MTDEPRPAPPRPRARCPSCGAPLLPPDTATPTARPAWAPFCSERCKTVDLARWLRGEQAIPGEPVHIAEAEGEA